VDLGHIKGLPLPMVAATRNRPAGAERHTGLADIVYIDPETQSGGWGGRWLLLAVVAYQCCAASNCGADQ
jgi:hypothetical protein